jgi:hypothetical protein
MYFPTYFVICITLRNSQTQFWFLTHGELVAKGIQSETLGILE